MKEYKNKFIEKLAQYNLISSISPVNKDLYLSILTKEAEKNGLFLKFNSSEKIAQNAYNFTFSSEYRRDRKIISLTYAKDYENRDFNNLPYLYFLASTDTEKDWFSDAKAGLERLFQQKADVIYEDIRNNLLTGEWHLSAGEMHDQSWIERQIKDIRLTSYLKIKTA